jgi:hypothetical protein
VVTVSLRRNTLKMKIVAILAGLTLFAAACGNHGTPAEDATHTNGDCTVDYNHYDTVVGSTQTPTSRVTIDEDCDRTRHIFQYGEETTEANPNPLTETYTVVTEIECTQIGGQPKVCGASIVEESGVTGTSYALLAGVGEFILFQYAPDGFYAYDNFVRTLVDGVVSPSSTGFDEYHV